MSWACAMMIGGHCCCTTTQFNHFKARVWHCSWAAYVAGPVVVLMHELGLRYDDGLRLKCLCSWAAYVAGPLVVLMHELGLQYDAWLSLLLYHYSVNSFQSRGASLQMGSLCCGAPRGAHARVGLAL